MSTNSKNIFGRITALWHKMTASSKGGAEEVPQEYMTKTILAIMWGILLGLFLPLTTIVWIMGSLDISAPILILGGGIVTWSGWWLAYRGHWYLGSYLPPLIFYLGGVERMYSSGPGTMGILSFIMAIVLAAMLPGGVVHWIVLTLSVVAIGILGDIHAQGNLPWSSPLSSFFAWLLMGSILLVLITVSIDFFRNQLQHSLRRVQTYAMELEGHKANLEQQVTERTAELEESIKERERLHQQIQEAQRETIRELATPIIPVLERVFVMPLIGTIDTARAQDILRAIMAGIGRYQAHTVILDITGVPLVDSGIARHLNKTIQVARLKGARVIITGVSNIIAESIVDLGLDWREIETCYDLQSGMQLVIQEGVSVH